MREIKFRAWNKHDSKMIDPFYLVDDIFTAKKHLYFPQYGSNVFMQYTGLKDQDLKEVYEGDIVKCKKYGQDIIGVIQYESIHWFVNVNKNMHYLGSISHLEVIGNIYENGYLLNAK